MTILKGKNVSIRTIKKVDLKLIRDLRNLPSFRKFSIQYELLNMYKQNLWFQSLLNENDKIMFSIVDKKNIVIGVCGLTNIDWKNKHASIAILIGSLKKQSKGLGSESLELLLNYGYNQMKLHRIVADVIEYNKTSIIFFEKFNFQLDAIFRDYLFRDGRWWNLLSYSKILKKEK